MALTAVTHECRSHFSQWTVACASLDYCQGFFSHFIEDPVDSRAIQIIKGHMKTAYNFIRDRCLEETDGRPDTGIVRNDEAVYTQLVDQSGDMQRRRTAECDYRVFCHIVPFFYGMNTYGVGHGFVYHFIDRKCRHLGSESL